MRNSPPFFTLKSFIILGIFSLMVTACGGGGGASNLTEAQARDVFQQDVANAQTDISARLAFSPPRDITCAVYGDSSSFTDKKECLVFVAADETGFCAQPSGDFGENRVDIYMEIPLAAESEMTLFANDCRNGLEFVPVLLTESPVSFGTHNPAADYTAQGEVCFNADDLANLSASATLTDSQASEHLIGLSQDGEGCFMLNDVRSLDAGSYEVVVGATTADGKISKAVGSVGSVVVSARTYEVGETGPAGGVVFYVSNGGLNGLEAAPQDQGSANWGCLGSSIEGADGTAIGTGAQNTVDIVAGCADEGIAAKVAADYELNGFDDWFLPSKDELGELLSQRDTVGGFSGDYWSSSELDADSAWFYISSSQILYNYQKYAYWQIRPIRAF